MLNDLAVGTVVNGDVLLTNVQFKLTKNGSEMFSATVVGNGGGKAQAVCFDSTVARELQQAGVNSFEAHIHAEVNSYNDMKNLKIVTVSDVRTEYDASRYLESLPLKEVVGKFNSTTKRMLSEKAHKIIVGFLDEHRTPIIYGMASQYGGRHDGYVGGLLNHVNKMLSYLEIYLGIEQTFSEKERDLLTMGVILHDIGKIIELKNGSYTPESIVTHCVSGCMLVEKHLKDVIVEEYGEMFYLELIAIISQHHGEYGERPKTAYSYIIHVLDYFESRLSTLHEKFITGETTIKADEFLVKFNRYE